jgi:nucleoside-diphosphate-sugar epimerase
VRVFVTGGTGHSDSYIIPELIAAGHEVTGLARSDTAAAAVSALGAKVRRGDLEDLDGLKEAAADSDGVIHVAQRQDLLPSGGLDAVAAAELPIVLAYGEALAGTGKHWLAREPGPPGHQAGPGPSRRRRGRGNPAGSQRRGNRRGRPRRSGVRSSVMRIATIAHSTTDRAGFLVRLIALAKEKGFVGYPGGGTNLWNAVHARDVASVFRLALEEGPAGRDWHAMGEGPSRSAKANLITRRTLSWEPARPGRLAALDNGLTSPAADGKDPAWLACSARKGRCRWQRSRAVRRAVATGGAVHHRLTCAPLRTIR